MASRKTVVRQNIRFARRAKADLKAYGDLLETPHDFGAITDVVETPLLLPANGRFAISCSDAMDAGAVEVIIGSQRKFSHPALAGGEIFKGTVGEKGQSVSLSVAEGVTGTLSLFVIDGFGTPLLIAQGEIGAAGGASARMFIVGSTKRAAQSYDIPDVTDITAATPGTAYIVGAYDRSISGVAFNDDGTRAYIASYEQKIIRELSLSTPYDVSTATILSTMNIFAYTSGSSDLRFKSDGTKMFIHSYGDNIIYAFTLSTPWNLATATYDSVSHSMAAEYASGYAIGFSVDGTKYYMMASSAGSNILYQYDLSMAWDISTMSYASKSFNPSIAANGALSSGRGGIVSSDGTRMILANNPSIQIQLVTPWDLATAVFGSLYVMATVITKGLTTNINCVNVSADGTKLITADTNSRVTVCSLNRAFSLGYSGTRSGVLAENTIWTGIAMKPDGTKVYVLGQNGNDTVYQYSLGTAWDASTLSYDSKSINVSAQDNTSCGLAFNDDGTKMYVLGQTNDRVYQYTLSTAWDVSTATYATKYAAVGTQDGTGQGLTFKPDGTKMYVIGDANDRIYQYALSTAWDVSTATYETKFAALSSYNYNSSYLTAATKGLGFSTDGTKIIAIGVNNAVYTINLSTAWDVSTASDASLYSKLARGGGGVTSGQSGGCLSADGNYVAIIYSFTTADIRRVMIWRLADTAKPYPTASTTTIVLEPRQDNIPVGCAMKPDGTKFFFAGQTNNLVYEYNLSTPFDLSTATFVQSFSPVAQISALVGMAMSADGTKMVLQRSGTGAVFLYNLSTPWNLSTAVYASKTFASTQVTAGVVGMDMSEDGTKLIITSNQSPTPNIYQYTLSTAWDVSTATYDGLFNYSPAESTASGLTFKPDGTEVYVCGTASDFVRQYHLTTAFDLSTAQYQQKFAYLGGMEGNMEALAFNTTGTRLYVLGSSGDKVYQVDLSTAWDILTAVYTTNQFISVSSQETAGKGLSFNGDGTRMFIVGQSGDKVFQYNLSTPWDVTTATYPTIFGAIVTQDTLSVGLAIKPDGTKVYMLGDTADIVYQYTLSTPWNPSTISYDSVSFSVATQTTSPSDIWFSADGTSMFILDNGTDDRVLKYTLSTAWDVSTAAFVGSTGILVLAMGMVGIIIDMAYSPDGMHLYGATSGTVQQFDLATAWDVRTAVFPGKILSAANGETGQGGIDCVAGA